jgi:hypothetical protein
MRTAFTLELYYEPGVGQGFAADSAERLKRLVSMLAPHVDLTVLVLPTQNIVRSRFLYDGKTLDVPNHAPLSQQHQSLLITTEDIQAEGWAGLGRGCLSKSRMSAKINAGGDSADITIHEWLHTVEGAEIDGWRIPNPHSNGQYGFVNPSGRSDDGGET